MSAASHLGLGLLSLIVAWALLTAANAQAAIVTVGNPLTASFYPNSVGDPATFANFVLPEAGANVTSPVTGTIIRWRITGATGGPFRLRVLAPNGGVTYTGAGVSEPHSPFSTATEPFTTNLPISAGELIGLDLPTGSDQIGFAASGGSGAAWGFWVPPLGEGEMRAGSTGSSDTEIGFNADVQPQPGMSSIGPSSGSISGGTTVVITGHDLNGASA